MCTLCVKDNFPQIYCFWLSLSTCTFTQTLEAATRGVLQKKVVLKNFTKFTGKLLCQSLLFSKVVGLRTATLLKKRLWHRFFPVNFVKFLRTPFLPEHLRWLLLKHENKKMSLYIKAAPTVLQVIFINKDMFCTIKFQFDLYGRILVPS